MSNRAHRAIVVACGVLAASLWLPWLRLRVGTGWTSTSLLELPALPWVLGLLLVIGAVTSWRALRSQGELDLLVAGTAFAVWAALPVALVLVAWGAQALAPMGLLPRSMGRLLLDTRPDVGLVLAVVAATGALGALLHAAGLVDLPETIELLARRSRGVRVAAAAGILAGVAAWRLRYEPWIVLRGGDRELLVEGWALPWVGLGSLLAVTVALVALVAGLLHRRLLTGVAVASAAWVASLLTAVAIGLGLLAERVAGEAGALLPSLLARLPREVVAFDGFTPFMVADVEIDPGFGFEPIGEQLIAAMPAVELTSAPWSTFVAVLVLAAAGVVMTARSEEAP